MTQRSDALFTVVTDHDLHDNKFRAVHYIGNDHVDLQIPHNSHRFRTVHLGLSHLLAWSYRLHRFYRDLLALNPELPTDYQI